MWAERLGFEARDHGSGEDAQSLLFAGLRSKVVVVVAEQLSTFPAQLYVLRVPLDWLFEVMDIEWLHAYRDWRVALV